MDRIHLIMKCPSELAPCRSNQLGKTKHRGRNSRKPQAPNSRGKGFSAPRLIRTLKCRIRLLPVQILPPGHQIRLIPTLICFDPVPTSSDSAPCARFSPVVVFERSGRGSGSEEMAGKGGKALLVARTMAAKSAEKDNGEKATISRSSRASLQPLAAWSLYLPAVGDGLSSVRSPLFLHGGDGYD
ncbi:hypothetical protein GUJ93_ZPchr0011g27085 [Zizania palustris]|uniref:Uncharacterized protein n=1 Tax=Zizania palustris TaxID=103762 RepID=A0A8J5WH92_ZIZPA|nr:hypothetical protein GUJ93_ZPchr0011g27085 [Zizania palustris]